MVSRSLSRTGATADEAGAVFSTGDSRIFADQMTMQDAL
jgi:hypothetical protein